MTKLPDFSKRSIDERIDTVVRLRDLNAQEEDLLRNSFNGISREQADNAIENCICGNPLMGIVTNARINNKDYLIPLVTEEPSIVAGASRAFKLGRDAGIEAQSTRNLLVGQIKLINVTGKEAARETLRKNTHPTVKPLTLMLYLITLGSREGDVVLDPFLGSVTTAIAAKQLDRGYIGIEREKEYVEIAEARLKTVQDKLPLPPTP